SLSRLFFKVGIASSKELVPHPSSSSRPNSTSPRKESKRNPKYPIHSADHNYAQHLEVHRAKKKIIAHYSYSAKKSGVDARAAKDKLELKAVQDGSASYAALERKAKIYNKLVRGELSEEEDEEKYCVDFFRKGLKQDGSQMPKEKDASTLQAQDIDR
ncbi:uncharacterized protein at4g18255, partial [Phtheirospermum japonicum]